MNSISIDELENLFKIVIDKLKEDSVSKIDLNTIFYKEITADAWDLYNPKTLEEIVTIGDLQDDLEEVKKLLNDSDRMCTYVDFDRIANILHAVSQELNPLE